MYLNIHVLLIRKFDLYYYLELTLPSIYGKSHKNVLPWIISKWPLDVKVCSALLSKVYFFEE